MKNILLTAAAIASFAFASQAQTQFGKTAIGGAVAFNSLKIKNSDHKTNSFAIQPQVGFFVANNISVGAGVGYAWSESQLNSVKNTVNAFIAAPFARAYQGNGALKVFGQLSAPMAWGSEKVNGKKSTSASYGVALAPGLAYFPTEKIGIELSVRGLYFNTESVKDGETSHKVRANEFGLNANSLAPSLGVQFHF